MSDVKFYYCPICGNIFEVINDSGNTPSCCGKEMIILEAGVTNGKIEAHVPVFKVKSGIVKVKVGDTPHPMNEDHYIQWILLVTDKGVYRKCLKPGDDPCTHFTICEDEKPCAVYAFCNIHKLWKKD